MCQHRAHSCPPWDHCTPDSLHGREHTGASLGRSPGDRTDGTCHHAGRSQVSTLGEGGGSKLPQQLEKGSN
jgi:hypothetical protein